MSFKVKIASVRIGIPEKRHEHIKEEVAHLVRLLKSPTEFYNLVQAERRDDENIKQTFERVQEDIFQKTGLTRYADYGCFKVAKHRIQKKERFGQPTLFDHLK